MANRQFGLIGDVFNTANFSTRIDEVITSYFNSGGDIGNTNDLQTCKSLAITLYNEQLLPAPVQFDLSGEQNDLGWNTISVTVRAIP